MFAGLIIVHFFTETMNAGTRSIVRNRTLVQKMAVPREMFPVASMLVSLFHVGPQLVILRDRDLAVRLEPRPVGHRARLHGLLISMVLGTALALVFSAANVFLRDVSNAVSVLSNFVRFGVPMMYPYVLVAQRFHGHTDLVPAQPDHRGGARLPARLLGRGDEPPGPDRGESTCRPTCSCSACGRC